MLDNYTTSVKHLFQLYLESSKLTLTQKLSQLLSTLAIGVICLALSMMALFFATIVVADLLEEVIDPIWAYLIITGVYIILVIVAYMLRKPLVLNPISRYISRMILDEPGEDEK